MKYIIALVYSYLAGHYRRDNDQGADASELYHVAIFTMLLGDWRG